MAVWAPHEAQPLRDEFSSSGTAEMTKPRRVPPSAPPLAVAWTAGQRGGCKPRRHGGTSRLLHPSHRRQPSAITLLATDRRSALGLMGTPRAVSYRLLTPLDMWVRKGSTRLSRPPDEQDRRSRGRRRGAVSVLVRSAGLCSCRWITAKLAQIHARGQQTFTPNTLPAGPTAARNLRVDQRFIPNEASDAQS